MKCAELDLLTLLEDDLSDERKKYMLSHIDSCPNCKEKYKNLEWISSVLSTFYGMESCLRSEEMVGFLEGSISHKVKKKIEDHLRECSKCRDELDFIKSVYRLEEVPLSENVPTAFFRKPAGVFAKKDKGPKVRTTKKEKKETNAVGEYEAFKQKIDEEYERSFRKKREGKKNK